MRRFLALGDSYTIGEGVSASERWPSVVAERLRQQGADISDPQLIARTAWTADELLDAVVAAHPNGPFDLVTLMVGVNDHYRGRDLATFATFFDPLLQTTMSLAGDARGVVVVSIPDWGHSPFAAARDRAGISATLDAFNDWLRERVHTEGIAWVDVTRSSREMLTNARLVAPDALHPSGEMHRRWAELILPAAAAALGARWPDARGCD